MIQFEQSGGPLTTADFNEIETSMSVRVPSDLKELYFNGNGGTPTSSLVPIHDWTGRVHEFLQFKYGGANGVEAVYQDLVVEEKVFPIDCIPFAIDEGGTIFCTAWNEGQLGKFTFLTVTRLIVPRRRY